MNIIKKRSGAPEKQTHQGRIETQIHERTHAHTHPHPQKGQTNEAPTTSNTCFLV